jgi:xanthine dehydrogenase accessory factor
MKELRALLEQMALPSGGEGAVLATLVSVEGSSYRRPGVRLLWTAEGSRVGSISGGCLEEDVCVRASAVAKSGRAEVAVYDTTSENDLVWGVGLGCHGIVRVLLEPLSARSAWPARLAANLAARIATDIAVVWERADSGFIGTALADEARGLPAEAKVFRERIVPPPPLFIFGAGDDAQPLARAAKELGWRVTVADPRPAYATAARFPTADSLAVASAEELAARVAPGPDALVVIMTHHYLHDAPLLRDLLPRPLAYLGLLGPRKRAERILSDLSKNGSAPTQEQARRLHAPVGLDLGAETPEEVALSILAEMRAALAGRDGRPLREREGPIHE